MHPATLHMASESILGYIFRHFAAFMESMTLNLAQRSFRVIDFGIKRKRVLRVYVLPQMYFRDMAPM